MLYTIYNKYRYGDIENKTQTLVLIGFQPYIYKTMPFKYGCGLTNVIWLLGVLIETDIAFDLFSKAILKIDKIHKLN